MSGPESGEPPEELTGEEQDEIRRLLGDARHTEPMPAHVVARMDAALADLASPTAEDAKTQPPLATVTSLSAHRRRRAGGLMVAAAAIVVAGIAVTQHLPDGGTTNAGSAATDRAPANAGAEADSGTAQSPSRSPEPSHPVASLKVSQGRVVVHARTFPAEARAAQRLTAGSYSADRNQPSAAPDAAGCVPVPTDSLTVPATFQRAQAVLVFLRPEGDTQVVDLYLCGQSQPVRSVTLPAP